VAVGDIPTIVSRLHDIGKSCGRAWDGGDARRQQDKAPDQ
jgi:hypothetical protein